MPNVLFIPNDQIFKNVYDVPTLKAIRLTSFFGSSCIDGHLLFGVLRLQKSREYIREKIEQLEKSDLLKHVRKVVLCTSAYYLTSVADDYHQIGNRSGHRRSWRILHGILERNRESRSYYNDLETFYKFLPDIFTKIFENAKTPICIIVEMDHKKEIDDYAVQRRTKLKTQTLEMFVLGCFDNTLGCIFEEHLEKKTTCCLTEIVYPISYIAHCNLLMPKPGWRTPYSVGTGTCYTMEICGKPGNQTCVYKRRATI